MPLIGGFGDLLEAHRLRRESNRITINRWAHVGNKASFLFREALP
jgi:hypothetical protein